MPTVPTPDDRRHFSRIPFHRPAILELGGKELACVLHDVSLKGALVELPGATGLFQNQRCALAIRLGGDAVIRMDVVVAHQEGTTLGVRCTGIDLDSIAHLRRLVEMNLGDEELLHRELAALVHRPER